MCFLTDKPKVNLTTANDNLQVTEGNTVMMWCDSDANPMPNKYEFYHEVSHSFFFIKRLTNFSQDHIMKMFISHSKLIYV